MALFQLHGLVPPETPQQSQAPEHEILECGEVSVLISGLQDERAFEASSAEELATWAMKHHAILVAYCADWTVVPAAIGSVFSNRSAILTEVRAHMDHYVNTLKTLNNIQEYTLRLTFTGSPAPTQARPATGRQFLAMQRMRHKGRDNLRASRRTLAQQLLDQLQSCTVQLQPSTSQKTGDVLNCVLLAKKSEVKHLHHLSRRFHTQAEDLGVELAITGPWPPYSSHALMPANKEFEHVVGA